MKSNNENNRRYSGYDNYEKQNFFIRLLSNQKFIAFIAFVFLVSLAFPLAKSYSKRMVAEKEIDEMRNRIAKFEKDNQELNELLEYLSSPQAAEEKGRLSLNLKKPGEGVIVIDKEDYEINASSNRQHDDKAKGVKLWWAYFFN